MISLILVFLFCNAYSPGLWRKENNEIIYSFQDEELDRILRTLPFTLQHLRLALEINVLHPDIVYAQALIETGSFTSRIFREHNNLFGMHYATKRPKLQASYFYADYHRKKWHRVAHYNHWYDAVLDYKLYQEYYDSLGYDMSNYYSFMRKVGYSASKQYTKSLEKIVN